MIGKASPKRYEYRGSIFYAETKREAAGKFSAWLGRPVAMTEIASLREIDRESGEVVDARKAPGA